MKHDDMKADNSAKAVKVTGKISDDGKMFVSDKDGKSWTISNPDAIKGHEGHHVTLTAHVYADKNEVHVMSLKMAKTIWKRTAWISEWLASPRPGQLFDWPLIGESRTLQFLAADETYLIAREALGNAMRHSLGSEVLCELRYEENELLLIAQDNGVGMSEEMLASASGTRQRPGLISSSESFEKFGMR
jgi:hypothetical protein